MKNSHIFIVLALVLSTQWSMVVAQSASTRVNHYVGVSAEVGEWTLLPLGATEDDDKTRTSVPQKSGFTLGGAGGVGFTYELQYGKSYSSARLLFNLGLGARGGNTRTLTTSSNTPGDQPIDGDVVQSPARMTAAEGNGTGTINYSNIMLRIPVLVGMQYNRFYFLAGGKFDIRLWETTKIGFDSFVFNATAEIGCRVGKINTETGYDVPKSTTEYRLAAFADCGFGLKNIDSSRKNLLAGIKFTVLFQRKERQKSVIEYDGYMEHMPVTHKAGRSRIDHDGYTGSGSRSTGSGGVKYEE